MAPANDKLRIDKYLWAIRVYKTRSIATEACKAGKVKMGSQSLKPAHIVKIGDLYTIQKDQQKKILKVLALLEKRVDAAKAAPFFEDLTPPELDPKFITVFNAPVLKRDRGTGRPTKRDRREIDDLQDSWD